MTLDNALNNTTLLNELVDLIDGFQDTTTQIRCFAHVLNLVIKVCVSAYTLMSYSI
jgi:hypothetical protein